MKKQMVTLIAAMLVSCGLLAQSSSEEFTPSGKIDGRIFANFNTQIGADGENASAFELKRAYVGYTYKMSPEYSARVLTDIGYGVNGNYLFFKNAAVFYTKNNLKVGFGIQGTYSIKYQYKIWGRRYISKSFQDNNKMATTADLGISAEYKLNNLVFDLAFFNGEGYKNMQADNAYLTSVGVAVFLMDDKMVLRATDEYVNNGIAQNNIAILAGFKNDKFSVGLEHNIQTNYRFTDGVDAAGSSIYGDFNFNKSFSVFARYDAFALSSVNDVEAYLITGVEYKLLKNLRASANLQQNVDTNGDAINFIFLNIEAKF